MGLTIPDVLLVLGKVGACESSIRYVNDKLTPQAALDHATTKWLTWLIEVLIEDSLMDRALVGRELESLAKKAAAAFPGDFHADSLNALAAYDFSQRKTEDFVAHMQRTDAVWRATSEATRRESAAWLVAALYETTRADHDARVAGSNLETSIKSWLHLNSDAEYATLDEATRVELCKTAAPWLFEVFERVAPKIKEDTQDEDMPSDEDYEGGYEEE
jgi:hypothetical protein